MTIKLNLNKSSIFRVAGFLADLNVNKQIEETIKNVNLDEVNETSKMIIGGQLILKIIASAEEETDELLADLADVSIGEIRALDADEYFDLVESFIKAGLFQRAFKLIQV